MPTLYEISAPSYLQTLKSVSNCLAKGKAHAEENGIDLNDLRESRIFEDMMPLTFQIASVCHHSLGALEGAQAGKFTPPPSWNDKSYTDLQAEVDATIKKIEGIDAASIDALENSDMVFELGRNQLPFVVKDFIQTFSLPNFYFHATTAYDILRMKGVPLGKMDYLGAMKMKG